MQHLMKNKNNKTEERAGIASSVTYWTTRNGRKIDVDKMSDSHLRNTLKMIIRSGVLEINAIKQLYNPKKRGNMEIAFEEELANHLYDDREEDFI